MHYDEIKFVYRISLAIFFNLAVQFYFRLPFLKYGLLLIIGSPLNITATTKTVAEMIGMQ